MQIDSNIMHGVTDVADYALYAKSLADMISARFSHLPAAAPKEWKAVRSVFSHPTIREHSLLFEWFPTTSP